MTDQTIQMTDDDWCKAVIAQDDDNDYQESGWVAWVVGDRAYLGSYSHCSCFGTFDALSGGNYSTSGNGAVSFNWSGSVDELVAMARVNGDPGLPGRTADPKDSDYDHLVETYKQVIAWDARGRVAEQTS